MDKETYRQVVNALAVIGLTLEHADYLFDNDSKALVQVDDALLAAGIDAEELRNRQIDRIIEDTEAFNDARHEALVDSETDFGDEVRKIRNTRAFAFDGHYGERRSFEERRGIRSSFGHDRRRPYDPETRGDRRIGFVPTHHLTDPLDKCNWP